MTTIGLLKEHPLHAALKRWYRRPGDVLEAAVDGYIVDLLRGTHIIEMQTGHVAAIRRKLQTLSQQYRVTLVYPVADACWLVKLPPTRSGQPERQRFAAHRQRFRLQRRSLKQTRAQCEPLRQRWASLQPTGTG